MLRSRTSSLSHTLWFPFSPFFATRFRFRFDSLHFDLFFHSERDAHKSGYLTHKNLPHIFSLTRTMTIPQENYTQRNTFTTIIINFTTRHFIISQQPIPLLNTFQESSWFVFLDNNSMSNDSIQKLFKYLSQMRSRNTCRRWF
jgi:hypothetical protein